MSKQKVYLFCGGPSSEHEVSVYSAQSIWEKVNHKMYELSVFFIGKDMRSIVFQPKGKFKIPEKSARFKPFLELLQSCKEDFDIALLAALHGEFVEDGQIQGILEYFNIPFTGSRRESCALAMDKYRSMLLVKDLQGIKLPKTKFVDLVRYKGGEEGFSYPFVVKPNDRGSSVGVKIVHDEKALKEHIDELRNKLNVRYALFQEYLEGALECSCGALEYKNGKFTKLPPIEIIPQVADFFSYEAKYEKGASREVCPPEQMDKKTADFISDVTCKIQQLLGCKTYQRSDFLIKDGEVYYLETNTLPGMTATSLLPQEAQAIGMEFPELIDYLIKNV